MKYLVNNFTISMVLEGKFSGMPISLAQAKALAKDAKIIDDYKNLAITVGDQIICMIPKRANEAREFNFEEMFAGGFRAFLIDVTPAPKLPEEETGKPVEWTWNNGMQSRSRMPRCLVVTPNGDIFRFTGTSIPGVVKVLGYDHQRSGKWSNSTYRCVSPKGTTPVSWVQDWNTGLAFPQDTWEEAFAWLKNQAPNARMESFETVLRKEFPQTAARFDENRNALKEMGA